MTTELTDRFAEYHRWRSILPAVALLLLLVHLNPSNACADDAPGVDIRIDHHLQAGEFAPALELAGRIADPGDRDRAMARIAEAQVRRGMHRAGLDTASRVADDRLRTGVLDTAAGYSGDAGGAAGGGAMADFDSLINLITATLSPESWEALGGPGAIDSFPGGVFVDAGGRMQRLTVRDMAALSELRQRSFSASGNQDVRRASPLRKVSLTRLEKQLQLRWAQRLGPTEEMRMLAGMERLRFIFVYPETGDIVLAGPAGDWELDAEGRSVSSTTGRPILQLDDFIVVFRNAVQAGGQFTCSITPRQANLAAARAYLDETTRRPLKAGQAKSWVDGLRDTLGLQDIEVQGIDPRTRVSRVIVEADYRMKLVGMGLEDGVLGLTSYLDSLPMGEARPMSVLRWWFTLGHDALHATPSRDAFEIRGQVVRVLSENEMLDELGQRIHTGEADEWNARFAHDFTRHFEALAAKYPIYADLQNVFDLALAAGLIVAQDLPAQVDWHFLHLGQPDRFHVGLAAAPQTVQTVANYRADRQGAILAGVSGGVSVNTGPLVEDQAIRIDDYGVLTAEHQGARPDDLPDNAWWWD